MFKVGDSVRIVTTAFDETVGTVVEVVSGRVGAVPREFVVQTTSGFHRFFAEQLTHEPDPQDEDGAVA
jgi:hypothetical protein